MQLRITREAISDLDRIRRFGDANFGSAATSDYILGLLNLFDLICEAPRMAHEQTETMEGLRMHPHRAHNILYMIEENDVVILRIIHNRQNWRNHI